MSKDTALTKLREWLKQQGYTGPFNLSQAIQCADPKTSLNSWRITLSEPSEVFYVNESTGDVRYPFGVFSPE
jgi:hypothetical protein